MNTDRITLVKDYEDEDGLHVILENIPMCVANAIRRTILSDIPVVVIRTENSSINECNITGNTSRFHNEIVKQRLSCIPIMVKDLDEIKDYTLQLNVQNNSDYEFRIVTSDDFKLQHKDNTFMEEHELKRIFPHDKISNYPIEFLRLRPSIGTTIPGEKIALSANFSISTAGVDGMFNAVSKCTYHNVIDAESVKNLWRYYEEQLKAEDKSSQEIEFEKKNFENLDAQRAYKIDANGDPNAFEFEIKTIGQYTNYELFQKSCEIIISKAKQFIEDIESNSENVPIHQSKMSKELGYTSVISAIEDSYDIILLNEDYTMGYLYEYFLFNMFYSEEGRLSFIGFKKYHPHDDYSVLRVCSPTGTLKYIKEKVIESSQKIIEVFKNIQRKFDRT